MGWSFDLSPSIAHVGRVSECGDPCPTVSQPWKGYWWYYTCTYMYFKYLLLLQCLSSSLLYTNLKSCDIFFSAQSVYLTFLWSAAAFHWHRCAAQSIQFRSNRFPIFIFALDKISTYVIDLSILPRSSVIWEILHSSRHLDQECPQALTYIYPLLCPPK